MKLVIPEPRLIEPSPGTWRVTANIAGQETYIESSAPLSPRVEAFVCAMLFPAMRRGWHLDARAGLSRATVENLHKAQLTARRWWPRLPAVEIRAPSAAERARPARDCSSPAGWIRPSRCGGSTTKSASWCLWKVLMWN